MILSLEQVKNWIKTIAPETAGKIAVGNIDGNKEYFVGVYDGKRPPPQRICIGGYEQTRYAQKTVRILLHWSKIPVEAEAEAQSLWASMSGANGFMMGKIPVVSIDASGSPVSVGRDEYGVCEYVINLIITYERMT